MTTSGFESLESVPRRLRAERDSVPSLSRPKEQKLRLHVERTTPLRSVVLSACGFKKKQLRPNSASVSRAARSGRLLENRPLIAIAVSPSSTDAAVERGVPCAAKSP